MSFEALLDHLRTLDVQLWVEGDRLRFRAPQGALTDDLRDALKARKDEILGFLRQAQEARDGALPPIARAPRDRDLPLSSSQERLWFLEQWQQEAGTAYNLIDAVRLRGVPDVGVLARCLREITRRHEILRTTYASRNGRPVQVVAPEADFHLAEVDLRNLPAGRREAAARSVLEELARLPFDLAAGPVLRAALLHLDTGEHRLLLELHHIASDGWSSGVMIGELSRLYALWTAEPGAALPSSLPSPLPALPLQYADYAVWQRQWLESPGFTAQLAFWKERLAGAEGVLELPADRPRPAVQSYRGGTRRFHLGASLCAALDRRAEAGTTRFMALLAGFAALLHRITGASDLLLGTPVANRRRPEVEPLIGFFVNTLVLRSELAGDPTAGAFLDRTRDGILEAFARQDVPFEKLVEELRPERDPSRSPLFQVLFVLQNAPAQPLSVPGLVLEPEILENDTAKFDLSLAVEDGAPPLFAALEYASDLFDATTAERLAAAFARLTEDLLAHPERRLSALTLLSEAERSQVLLEWNDSRTAYPREACIHDLVAEWAERTPEAVAVVWGEEELSYRELDARAGLLARRLRACGVGPDVRVAVLLERSADLVIALLAVLKAGGAFVPLDPAYPQERLTGLMEDARASVLISGPGLQVTGGEAESVGKVAPRVLPDNLAYVMFTSGTTGRPKGVAVPHRAVVRLVRGNHFARLDAGEVLLLLAPASFDATTLEIWGALVNGGRLVVYPGSKPTLKELGEVLERHRVSTLWLTAGLFHQMVEHNVQGLRPVRQLLSGGDVLSPQHVREALAALPGCTVINGYGPTENTTFTCCFAITDPAAVGEAVPIGRPIGSSRALVVDRDLRPVPVGVRGELLAGGDGLARGYLDRPDLTAERFVPDPTAGLLGLPGDRVYRTGDLVRLLPDGRIDFLGRIDQQVKIRGFRIEPAEIEAALGSHPAVAAAVVLARPGRSGVKADRELAAYLVLRPGMPPLDAAALRDFLRERLPEPMVPTAWVFLEELPLTANDKVDRRALAEIRTEAAGGLTGLTAPQTPTEEVTAGLWAEVLGRAALGVHDNFFDLGGHSLLAVQIVARLEQAFGVAVALRHLFEAPTVAGLAARIDRLLATGGAAALPPLPPITPVPHDRPLPLSFSQERLWFFEQLVPGSALYNTTRAGHLRGPLDLAALRATFDEILRRHEVLRTGYHTGPAGHPVQIVEPWRPADLPLVDLRGIPAERRQAEALRLGNEEAASPMPLDRPPLVRGAVLLFGPDEHVVLLSIHHICWDLGSGGVLLRELDQLYPAFAQGRPSPLPELPLQYADFAVWQRGWLSGEVLAEELAWWRENLAGVESRPLVLPSDRPRPAVETWSGGVCPFLIPHALAEPLRQLGRGRGATAFMTHLALFEALLVRYAPQPGLVVGTAISNRADPALEGLIGFFDNLLPLRTATDDAGELGFQPFLDRVREVALGAYTHQHLPFELLVQELRLERERSRTPLLQVIFLFQLNYPAMTRELAGLTMRPYQLRVESAKFDLTFSLREGPDGLVGQLEYNTDLFDAATIRRLAGHYEVLAAAVLDAPAGRLGELPLLTPAERHQVLEEWSDTRAPEVALVPEQVAARAVRRPAALAVVGGAEALTCGELDARAARLASRLRRLGVGPEVRVGVCAGRTPRLVVALLAVWKAGGAYLPLDPAYPPARIDFMLADAAAPVLLTERALAGRSAAPGLKVLFLDDLEDLAGAGEKVPAPAPAVPLLPEQTAYVIYTSGSTGTPKGVEVSHDALRRLTGWHLRAFGVTEDDVATLLAGLGFDAAVWEIWPALAAGARLELPDEAVRTAPEALRDWLLARGATVSFAPTPLAEALMALPWPPDAPLRLLLTGGDRLHRPPAAGLPFTLVNNYGPTENTVVATSGTVPPSPSHAPSIGRPIDHVTARVVDPGLQPLPAILPGELVIGGASLARGYLGRPDLTAERFLPDPWSPHPGARLYRTGDLVRWLPDGSLDFLGRIDQQVKIRGFRVELGEIEAALAACPGVEAAAVLVPESADGSRRLVAYVVGGADPATLRERLAERLPEHMIPALFLPLPALPLTPNGKVDRRALPEPVLESEAGFAAPSDPVEELLAGLWAELLGRGRVGVHDDFFALGGHSLLATQLMSRLRDTLGVELPLRALFEGATVAELARVVRATRSPSMAPPLLRLPLPPAERRSGLPLSFAQQRLWFLDQLAPGSPAYNIPAAVRLSGEVPVERLARVFAEVVRRHEALRTTFATREGRPVQVIAEDLPPERPPELPLLDLSGLPAEEREARARALAAAEAAQPFDLERGPLLRLLLVRLGDREHLLLMTLHHIVADGWSMGVLLREVGALWEALAEGKPALLPELPVQYADFAAWQRSWLRGEVLEAQLGYWRRQLAGAPQVLELPADRPRPELQTWRGAALPVHVAPPLAAGVHEICRREGTTPFMVLLAAWAAVLGRHAGQDDLLLGTPIAGRNRREIEGLIGFFVNTLVLRADLRKDPSFTGALGRVRAAALDAYAHQDLPFERLVEDLVPERDPSRSPLFQVLFALQNAPMGELTAPGLSLTPLTLDSGIAKLDLTLALREDPSGFTGSLEYNTDLFEAATIRRLAGHFKVLTAAALAAPGEPLGELPLLTEEERLQVLEEWNDTRVPVAPLLVPEQVAARAALRPAALAVVEGAEALTYGDLDARAARLAGRLRRLGVGPEVRVGVCAGRSPRLIEALLAVWKAGGAYLPLDPAYPPARIDFMLADAGVPVLLTERALAGRSAAPGLKVLFLDDLEDTGEKALAVPLLPEQTAYVIYTSGSTGTPKGVEVSHDALRRLAGWHLRAFGVTEDDVATLLAGLGFDAAVWEIWPALAAGARLELPDEVVRTAPEALRDWLLARGATVSFAPTPLAEALMALPWPAETPLRLLLTGGDRLNRPPAAGLPFTLVNNYGPTENTVVATSGTVLPGLPEAPSIGRPIDHVTARVVSPGLQLLPALVPGELVIGGASLARGYLGRPDLTAERFLLDPWSPHPGARLYRTGDLVRWLPDGSLDFLGRIDQQVKIRGFRVELGEIEAALAACPGVEAAAVLAPESADGSRRLVAYVVGDAEAAALRERLAESLPEHMIPALFLPLPELPLTPNGKVDRRALPEPAAESGAGFATPSDPVEELLAGLWAELLGRGRIGIHDDFFALGGHSLLATRLMSRLRGLLGVELPLRVLFEGPTVAALARVVRAAQGLSLPHPPPPLVRLPLPPAERRSGLPLSFAQQRLWFLDQLEPDSPAYNIPAAVRLSGELPVERLARIFAEVVRRHEALRTTFATREGRPLQVIAENLPPELPLVDLSGLPAEEREAQARALAAEEAARPFDLERGPLLRLALVRLGVREHLLLMTLHHIVADGWSMGVLLREVGALWEALALGRPASLPELPLQYADFAAWQRSWLQGEALEAQLGYWRRQLAGAPQVLELPIDRPRPAQQTFRGAAQPVHLPPPLAARVHEICRREGATPFMVLLAAWAAVLGRHAGQDDLLLGTPIAGRNRREIEGLIGFFVNTLVLRADLTGEPAFAQALGRVRAAALDAYAHQDVPFERLVEELAPERDQALSPLFQVLFTLQNAPMGELAVPGLSLTPLSLDSSVAKFDLSLALREDPSGFSGSLDYNTDLFDAATAERLGARFVTLLEGAVAAPATLLADLPLLLPDEWEQVLWAHNDTATDYPRDASLAELFAAVAREMPEAPAIVSGDETWTYRRLDEASNRLARHLRSLGVGIETPVGISLERSAELILGTLAIVKAGGLYVPLDAAYPDERLAFMLEDTGAGVVLVHEPTRERLSRLAPHLVSLDGGVWQAEDAAALEVPVPAECLGYVIYTSGSTGRPKGVAVPHRAIVRLVRETNYVRLGPGDRTGQVSNSSFDVATYEIWGALLNGAATVVIPREVILSPPDFAAELRRHRVTSMFLTSALFIKMSGEAPEAFAEMSELLVGGEAVDPVAARTVLAGRPPRRLLNGYGPTESTGFASWHHIREVPEGATTVPIGLPLSNTTLYVLDRRQAAVPPGVVGELCIGGDGLARCYLNRPELTAEKLVPHPWADGERLYRTGDLVRQRPDGPIEYLGRIDHQVKIRGFRIEPGEIEAVLAGHPEMRECAVLARRDNGEIRLVAYVVGRGGGAPRAEDLREWLLQRLPDFLVPSAYVVLDALPITPNGKLDRKALPAPERGRVGAESGGPGPRDALELELARLWEELLGVGPIGVRDDFFALGGHSLLAVQLAARLRSRLGRTVPVAALLRHSTVERLAAFLRQDEGGPLRRTPLVELASGNGQPLFLVHPIGGEVLSYAHLVRRLAGRSVWGIQAPETPETTAPETIEEQAAVYLRAVREVQPTGPYLLGGWSLGGVLAFEMARQLESGGEAVEAVLLVDSPAPEAPGRGGRLPDSELVAAFALDLARVLGIDEPAGPDLDFSDLGRLAEQAGRAGLLPPGLDAAELERRFSRWTAHLRALERYAGGPCAARLILLKATQRPADVVLPEDLGWGRLATVPVEVHELEGDHYTLLREPGVEKLAALVRECLLTLPAAP